MHNPVTIPTSLPLVPLHNKKVLLPGVVSKIVLRNRDSIFLLRRLHKIFDPKNFPIVGCIPIIRKTAPSTLQGSENDRVITNGPSSTGDDDNSTQAEPTTAPQVPVLHPQRPRRADKTKKSDDQLDAAPGEPPTSSEDLFTFGCAARIMRIERVGFGGFTIFVEGECEIILRSVISLFDYIYLTKSIQSNIAKSLQPPHSSGLSRFRVDRIIQETPYLIASVTHYPEPLEVSTAKAAEIHDQVLRFRALAREFLVKMKELQLPDALTAQLQRLVEQAPPSTLANLLVTVIDASFDERLSMLESTELGARLEKAGEWITRQLHVLKISQQVHSTIEDKLSKKQREFYLRQQVNINHQFSSRGSHIFALNPHNFSKFPPPPPAHPSKLNAIKEELGEKDSDDNLNSSGNTEEDEITDLGRRLADANLPEEAAAASQRELKRLKRLHPSTAEWSVVRTYLETVAELPWSKSSEDVLDIRRAREQLEADHYGCVWVRRLWRAGLDIVKKRILEYLSVVKVKGDLKAPIICFVGPVRNSLRFKPFRMHPIQISLTPIPICTHALSLLQPGVGKTSLGKSIATALSRRFHRISLGGVRDEADIRGHRRTYVGALPGLVIHGLKKCGVNNPVFLLDEIDKTASSSHYGDPTAALLEVLDPEQNNTFTDHYLNLPFDLSHVVFIATANTLDTIPPALLDRMEVIPLPGYTFEEKLHIARSHLVPKQVLEHGLKKGDVVMADDVVLRIAEGYTRESGVRGLERAIAAVVRAKCVEVAELREQGREDKYRPEVKVKDLEDILGIEKFDDEIAQRESIPGIVTGLAYTSSGSGGILFIEASQMPGKGNLQLTGKLGDVIKESAQIAMSWVKTHAYTLRLTASANSNVLENVDIHVHVPSGSVPKDGPSAGITIVTALVSLLSGRRVPPTTAMTGEITLRGNVLPVGGIKEKVIAAHRAGIHRIIVPFRNKKDVMGDVPAAVRDQIEFVFVKTVGDVLTEAFEVNKGTRRPEKVVVVESRL
ncbi:ATP-dependent protease La [Jimgerdemannia flammicorona]|uniref:Lon protease homolog n=1 Tax=Jimgerdemannia flammicorona TaxID=994334 RepID=A0A433DLW9_9FUNG|nr:ATP-dependent protease La [Jimgerdemannia flammicorona]